jgi:hypothetical protein
MKIKCCPDCMAVSFVAVKVCHHCGYDFHRLRAVEKAVVDIERYVNDISSAQLERLQKCISSNRSDVSQSPPL